MTSQQESLDDAIDRVAVAMTSVPDDGRIFDWSPARKSAQVTWGFRAVAGAGAAIGLVLLALATWSQRATEAPGPTATLTMVGMAALESRDLGASAMLTLHDASVGHANLPGIAPHRAPVRSSARSREVEPMASAFGLPALDGPRALQIDELGPPLSLTIAEVEPAPLALKQLEITGLEPDRKE